MANHALLYKCPHCGAAQEYEPQHEDQVVNCSNCGKPFELELPEARPEQQQDRKLIVTGDQRDRGPSAPSGQEHRDEGPQVLSREQEKTVAVIKPSIFRRYPGRVAAFGLLTILGIVFIVVGWQVMFYPLALIGVVFAIYGLYKLIGWLLWSRATNLTITNQGGSILNHGFFNQTSVEIDHDDIDLLHVHKGTINQVMRCGDLAIKPKGGKKQIVLTACPNPEEVANLIRAELTGEAENLNQRDVEEMKNP